jgi:hypothetical protein
MKTLIVATAVTCMAWATLAQGQFVFGNKNLLASPPIDAKVFKPDGVTPLSGADYWAQAYVGTSLDSLAPVGSPVNFRTGSNAGYIVSAVVTVPGLPKDTKVFVEMRAWEAGANSYEAAVAGGKLFGKSDPIQLTLTEAPNPPPDMVGLKSFSLVPEPSTMALGLLGAAALMLRRRS